MSFYLVYWLNEDNHIVGTPREIEGADDAEAIERALHGGDGAVEIGRWTASSRESGRT